MSKNEQRNNKPDDTNKDCMLSFNQIEEKNFDFIRKQNLKKLNLEAVNEKLDKEKTIKSNGRRRVDFSDDISLDQVERKLNRFSIAKDSLESSLANLPYSIEDSINYLTDNNFTKECILEEEENEFLTPIKLGKFNQNMQEYSTAEKTKFSNKLNDLQKSFVQNKTLSNKNISRIINNSFSKIPNTQAATGINNFLNTSTKNVNNISTDYKNKNFLNTSLKEQSNLNSASHTIGSNNNVFASQKLNGTEVKKPMKFNLKIDTIASKPIIENQENEAEEEEKIDVEKTAKIKYKYITSLFDSSNKKGKREEKKNTFFWFGAYDKLMSNKNIKKILNYYDRERFSDRASLNNFNNTLDSKRTSGFNKKLKEIPIILKDYELFFETNGGEADVPKTTKAFIRAKKDGICFLNLYYLNVEQINLIYNYINKTNIDLALKDFDNANNPGDFIEVNKSKKYGELLCLGSTINTNIYTFTKKFVEKPNEKAKPKIKYLVKLIKNHCKIFKNYSYEFFMYHIYSKTGMNKNLSPQDMQIIRSYFLKENNLKELGFTNKNTNRNSNNNYTNTNSNIDLESLQMKIKCSSQVNSKLFINEKFYAGNDYSHFIRNDSVEIDLVNNFNKFNNGTNIKNLKDEYQSHYNIIDISSNNIYFDNNQTINNNDSIESDFIRNKDKNKKVSLKETQKKSVDIRNKVLSKVFNSKNSISEKKNKILNQFYTNNSKPENKINYKNKFSSNIFNNKAGNFSNKAINIISPNDTGCEKSEFNNPNFNKTEEVNSFFNKDLIDSSLLVNSDASKSGLNNNNTINLKNNINTNSFLNSYSNTNKKSILSSASNFNIHMKKLDDKYSNRINNANNLKSNEDKKTPINNISISSLNKIEPKTKLVNNANNVSISSNKLNLNFISSLNNSKINSSNKSGFLNNNYFLKAKAELSSTNNQIKIIDNTYSMDSDLNDTVDQNKLNTYAEGEQENSNQVVQTENNLAISNGRKTLNVDNIVENILSPSNKNNSSINNLRVSNNTNNSSNNFKSNSKLFIPKNKIVPQEINTQNYSSVKNTNKKEIENNTTQKKNTIITSNAKKNSLKKVDKNQQVIEKNLSKNNNSLSINYNKNYNTDDVSFNIRQSINSMNRSIRNETNNNYNSNNSNIFVVSRDIGSRYKTDFDNSDDSDDERNFNGINATVGNLTEDNNGSNYNTPTKKRILKYYS